MESHNTTDGPASFVEREATTTSVGLTHLGGIRTVWQDLPHDNSVLLRFRVGIADEPLARRGFTHLAEHLALNGFRDAHFPLNGFTGLTTTTFVAQSDAQAPAFLTGVVASLGAIASGEIPDEAILHEASVLRAEAAQRGVSTVEDLLGALYGVRSYGAGAFPELGLSPLIIDDFRAWVADHFTIDNATISWASTPAHDLDTAGLQQGVWRPPPGIEPLVRPWPAYENRDGHVTIVAPIQRRPALLALAPLLNRSATSRLRHEAGVSYSPNFSMQPVTAEGALLFGGAEIDQAAGTLAVDAIIGELDRMAAGEIAPSELDWVRSNHEEYCDGPALSSDVVSGAGEDVLFRSEIRSTERVRALANDLEPEAIAARATEARASLVAAIPADATVTTRPLNKLAIIADARSDSEVVGLSRPRYDRTEQYAAHVDLDQTSISRMFYDATVRVTSENATALLTWNDGSIAVIGHRSEAVQIPAGAYTNEQEIRDRVGLWFEPWQVRPMGVRPNFVDTDQLPEPQRWPWWAAVIPPLLYLPTIDAPPGPGAAEVPALVWWLFLLIASLVLLRVGFRQLIDKGRRYEGRFLLDIALPNRPPQVLPRGAPIKPEPEHVPGALLVSWLAKRGHVQPWVEEALPDALGALRSGAARPSQLYADLNGISITDLFDEELTPLLAWLHAPRRLGKAPIDVILDSMGARYQHGRFGLDDTPWLEEQFDKRLRKSIRWFALGVPTKGIRLLWRHRSLLKPPPG